MLKKRSARYGALTRVSVGRARRVAHELLEWLCTSPEHTLVYEFLSQHGVLPEQVEKLRARDVGFKTLFDHAWQIQEAKLCRQLMLKGGNTSGLLFLLRHWHGWGDGLSSGKAASVLSTASSSRPYQGVSDEELGRMLEGYLGG
jgi:hypothetical protein